MLHLKLSSACAASQSGYCTISLACSPEYAFECAWQGRDLSTTPVMQGFLLAQKHFVLSALITPSGVCCKWCINKPSWVGLVNSWQTQKQSDMILQHQGALDADDIMHELIMSPSHKMLITLTAWAASYCRSPSTCGEYANAALDRIKLTCHEFSLYTSAYMVHV